MASLDRLILVIKIDLCLDGNEDAFNPLLFPLILIIAITLSAVCCGEETRDKF